ncbi:MAG: UDP-N-acetylmuramoyl-L-alanyl-D-glutamate--2,6-diaminopimelate ligase [Clostridia bacterium]|nr:UDP-N-acetylmuramoyl-L-alanyl-D-glutamate--2,6-diaminopimelate ligase [Clostridia bacterium]
MRLDILCAAVGIDCPEERRNDEVAAIETDSTRVRENCLFVCIRGLHTDGHRYADEAVRAGARWILCEEDGELPTVREATVLKARGTRRALAQLYHAWYGFPARRLSVIGVTGTNGKSSVSTMIAAILNGAGHSCGLIGTLGCELRGQKMESGSDDPLANMTTPDPKELYRILSKMADEGAEYVAMEVSSHALALDKVAPIDFSVGVFTNLTPEHLDFHHGMHDYAEAKARLFAQSEISVINADADAHGQMLAAARDRTCTYSARVDADYRADAIELRSDGVSYEFLTEQGSFPITSPIPARFTVENTALAAAVACELDIAKEDIQRALACLSGVKGRMERVKLPPDADITVLIDYAHTPDALERLLLTARELKRGELVLLFGCGGDRDRSKRPVMGRIASELADRIVLTSDNARTESKQKILGEILSGIPTDCDCTVIPDRREAIRHAILTAKTDALILLAGKGHEEYEIDGNVRRDFSEKKIAEEAYRERRTQGNGGRPQ